MTAKDYADITISIDCDGQDDVDAMDKMLEEYEDGAEIVYGVRAARDTDTVFKRTTAKWYYKILNLLGAEVVYNHADYRLMSRRALEALSQAMCPGNSCTLATSCKASWVTAVPHTPFPKGMRMQAGLP